MFFIRIILVCLMLLVFSQGSAQQEVLGLEELRKSIKRQEKIIRRLQSLISEQNLRQDELERSQPPVDLLESLYTDMKSMQVDLEEYLLRLARIEKLQKARVHGRPEKEKEITLNYLGNSNGNGNLGKFATVSFFQRKRQLRLITFCLSEKGKFISPYFPQFTFFLFYCSQKAKGNSP